MTPDDLAQMIQESYGKNVELSAAGREMLMLAYQRGQKDALVSLGIDPELVDDEGLIAWTV